MGVLGIDIGGSGIKGAIVNLKTGKFDSKRIRFNTPEGGAPKDVARVVAELSRQLKWKGKIGIGFPAVVKKQHTMTASNVSNSWIGLDASKLFSKATGSSVTVLNDADAAALAECKFGRRRLDKGLVVFVTIGTGLGTAILHQGDLIPNMELGHLQLKKVGTAEDYAADSVRKKKGLTWRIWALRFNKYLAEMEFLMHPDVFVIGGGVSKTPERFMPYMNLRTPVYMAKLKNHAGIIGAALATQRPPI